MYFWGLAVAESTAFFGMDTNIEQLYVLVRLNPAKSTVFLWAGGGGVKVFFGKIKDLSVNLSNNETNLELNYRVIEFKSQKAIFRSKMLVKIQ